MNSSDESFFQGDVRFASNSTRVRKESSPVA